MIGDVVGEWRAGHSHQGAGQRGRDQLQPQRRHAAGFRRELVVADGGEAEAEARALDHAGGHDRHDREEEHQQEQVLHVGQRHAENVDRRRADRIGAARAAEIVPVDDQRLQHDGERERRDREEGAAQAQRQVAHAEADDAGHDSAEQDEHRDRQRIGLVKEHGRVGAEREERRRAEIHVAAIAAEDVPGGGEHDELHHHVAGEEQVLAPEPAREREDRGRDRDADNKEDA